MYDLLIKGGEVIDPGQGLRGLLDVAIKNKKIAEVKKGISTDEASLVIFAQGKIVTPGLIDLHNHVYEGVNPACVPADKVGIKSGVTTLGDGGSAGCANFSDFLESTIKTSITTVFCFLNICSGGFRSFEIEDWKEIDAKATIETAKKYPEHIKGIKLLLHGALIRKDGLKIFKVSKKVAKELGLPLMIHIGDRNASYSWDLTEKMLPLMEQGDILSHIYTANPGRVINSNGQALAEFLKARDRGVVLDVAHGSRNFCFNTAQYAFEQGILPATISTDLMTFSINGPVYNIADTLSKFLLLGLDISKVIEMTTVNPARALGLEGKIGSLKVGLPADISILELKNFEKDYVDSIGSTRRGKVMVVPVTTIKSGKVISI